MILVVNEKRMTQVPNYTVEVSLTKRTAMSVAVAFVSQMSYPVSDTDKTEFVEHILNHRSPAISCRQCRLTHGSNHSYCLY